ncbi:glycosyltransferase family 4 protein [Denitromonas sp.]|uniref:glycosyltransferase family 4 protein n=1 Tax=Denitromonas sp. TaxID=2734609 RepID=UPI002AFF0768|nr:glycosyltransferase family 4 protein [Denitromonas sp.]
MASTYQESGIFSRYGIRYLSNFDGPGLRLQVMVMIRVTYYLLRELIGGNIFLVHFHSASRGSFWRVALLSAVVRIFRVPYIVHMHSGEFENFFYHECGSLSRRIIRSVLTCSKLVFCLTEGWRLKFLSIAPKANWIVLPNPVLFPPAHQSMIQGGAPNILYLGRVVEKKGIYDLLHAFAEVVKIFPACRLRIGGDGETLSVKEVAGTLNVLGNVDFLGWIDGERKAIALAHSTMLVVPSHFEAFGVAILEAMAYGKPVVATNVGGIPEIVSDGVHGLLVPPSMPSELADKLLMLLSNPTLARSMGAAGRAEVKSKYSTSCVECVLANAYESCGVTNWESRSDRTEHL